MANVGEYLMVNRPISILLKARYGPFVFTVHIYTLASRAYAPSSRRHIRGTSEYIFFLPVSCSRKRLSLQQGGVQMTFATTTEFEHFGKSTR
jgi:hypothetical protein